MRMERRINKNRKKEESIMIKADLEDIRFQLRHLGLNVKVSRKKFNYFCQGKINNRSFSVTISSKNDERSGVRNFMVAFFFGQEEKDLVPILSKFMGYKPFCTYLYRGDPKGFINYEWDKKCPEERIINLRENSDVYLVQRFEEGFKD